MLRLPIATLVAFALPFVERAVRAALLGLPIMLSDPGFLLTKATSTALPFVVLLLASEKVDWLHRGSWAAAKVGLGLTAAAWAVVSGYNYYIYYAILDRSMMVDAQTAMMVLPLVVTTVMAGVAWKSGRSASRSAAL